MTPGSDDQTTVLVVEDERDLADLYAAWLREEYHVEVAYDGDEALSILAETQVDVVFLDRHMPDTSGDEVLVTMRAWGLDARVAMVTGVSPGPDVLELGFDDYLVKPVGREELTGAAAELVTMPSYESLQRELSSLRVRRNVLEAEMSMERLETDERYRDVVDRIEELEREIDTYRGRVEGRAAGPGPALDGVAADGGSDVPADGEGEAAADD